MKYYSSLLIIIIFFLMFLEISLLRIGRKWFKVITYNVSNIY